MRKYIFPIITLAFFLLLFGHLMAMSSTNFDLGWLVPISSSGGGSASSTNYMTNLTMGQTVIGTMSGNNYRAGLGYWSGIETTNRLFLPLVIK